jgi:hypothetical protein
MRMGSPDLVVPSPSSRISSVRPDQRLAGQPLAESRVGFEIAAAELPQDESLGLDRPRPA